MIGHETTETEIMADKFGDCNNIFAAPMLAILAGYLFLWPYLLVAVMIVGPILAVYYARKWSQKDDET